MQAVIYVELTEELRYSYNKPLLQEINRRFPKVVLFDFDNHSDRLVVGYAIDLLEKADKAVVIIEATETSVFNIVGFLEKVLDYKDKSLVIVNGQHAIVNRMVSLLEENLLQDLPLPTQLEYITHFLEKQA